MRAYARLLIGLFLGLVIALASFAILVDPYDVLGGPRIKGFNAVKTRRDEDGRRVTVGEAVLDGAHGTFLFGSSRAVEGFPRLIATPEWPGGLFNAGMRGSTSFEMSRAIVLTGQSAATRCVIVGLDSGSYQALATTRSTYWISALPDGNADLAIARTSLSPNAFWRSVQTIRDNATGRPARVRYPGVYPPGQQRVHLLTGARNFLVTDQSFDYDPERLEFLMTALRGLAEHGVQVIGVIFPRHAWSDEALYESGRWEEEMRWRRDLVDGFAELAVNRPAAPCAADKSGAVLWDFTGFRMAPFSHPPSEQDTIAQSYFHEATHFSPLIGMAMLDLVQGRTAKPPFDVADFGNQLTPQNLAAQEAASLQRRAAWLQSDPEAKFITADFAALLAKNPPLWRPARIALSRDDWLAMNRDVRRMRPIEDRLKHIGARSQ